MRLALVAVVAALTMAGGSALAQNAMSKTRGPGEAAPAMRGESSDGAAKAISGAAKTDIDLRKGDAVDVRAPQPTQSGASIPFPYTAATEPPREPYRRPVPCALFARGTDGTTTCIGIEERSMQAARPSATRASRRAKSSPSQVSQREERPQPRRVAMPIRELTDPRFHQPPPDFVRQQQGGGGFLAFLGSVFSR